MIIYTAYAGRDLQNTMSLLNQFEAEGVTDIRFVRQRIQGHLDERFKTAQVKKIKEVKEARATRSIKPARCPSCGSDNWHEGKVLDGVVYDGCGDCYYSRRVGNGV